MTLRNARILLFLLTVISIAVFAHTDAFAQRGKKKGGGGGGGGTAPVQYHVLPIPYSKGRPVNPDDINIRGEACGTVGLSPGPFEAVYYDGAGTTWTLNDLVDLIDPQARDGWNIAYSMGMNDAGQITGGATRDDQTAAFLVDPYNATSPFVILPPSPLIENSQGSSVNNSGDIAVRATGDIVLLYSSIDQSYTYLTSGATPRGVSNRDASGNVYVAASVNGGSYRFLVNDGAVIESDWIPDASVRAVNDFGTVTGTVPGKRNSSVVFRYDNGIDVLKDGRKDLVGTASDINNDGDILIDYLKLYTPQHGALNLESLIHPDDRALFSDAFHLIHLEAFTGRDSTGFPVILTANYASSSSDSMDEAFILVPMLPSN